MSLYTFAAASLTTADDKKRCPAVDRGQVTRIVAFCLTLALALIVMAHRQSRAAESAFHVSHSALCLPGDGHQANRDTARPSGNGVDAKPTWLVTTR